MPETHVVETLPFFYAASATYTSCCLCTGCNAGVFLFQHLCRQRKADTGSTANAFKIFINLGTCRAIAWQHWMLTIGGIRGVHRLLHPTWAARQMVGIVALGPIWVWVIYLVQLRRCRLRKNTGTGRLLVGLLLILRCRSRSVHH
ncbi:MAG: hypothetical protein R3F24_13130 [Gammaproteobacteria bacterium]